jgi:hypothetical protein
MADLAIASPVSAVFLCHDHIRSQLAGVGGILQGQSVYLDPTTGTILPTAAAIAGKYQARGLSLNSAGPGQAVDVLESGYVAGYDLTALAFDALVYLSDTPGKLSSTAGTNSSVAGRVAASTDRDPVTNKPSKILYVRPSVI